MGFLERLQLHAADARHGPAVVAQGGEWSYPELAQRVLAGTRQLREQGVDDRAVVGITIADEAQHLVATLALLALGARQITLATHDQLPLQAEIAARVNLTHVVADTDVHLPPYPRIRWNADAAAVDGALPAATPGGLLLKTSGTTGSMNIVQFDEQQIGLQSGRHHDYAGERLLRLASIEHNNSKRHRLYCLWNGGANVFRPRDPTPILDFIESAGVTCLDISRMHASDIAAMEDARRLAHVKLRTGGSATPYAVRREIEEKVTSLVYVRYAATECGAISMAAPGEHDADECSGRALPGVQLEIVDESGTPVAAGTSGAIRLKAPGMADGYFDNPQQTAARFREGWFYPGDLGRIRVDGQLVVEGRADDMIILNGLNIFPAEIERVLQSHPAVATAAAFPLASAVHGQIPVAAVELRPGASATGHELQMFSRDALALRTPRKVLVMAQLPRNPQGKIMKNELVRMMKAGAK